MTEGQMNCIRHFAGDRSAGAFTDRDRYECSQQGWLGVTYDHRVMARITITTPWGVASLRQQRAPSAPIPTNVGATAMTHRAALSTRLRPQPVSPRPDT